MDFGMKVCGSRWTTSGYGNKVADFRAIIAPPTDSIQPVSLRAIVPADKVLEVNAGVIDRLE